MAQGWLLLKRMLQHIIYGNKKIKCVVLFIASTSLSEFSSIVPLSVIIMHYLRHYDHIIFGFQCALDNFFVVFIFSSFISFYLDGYLDYCHSTIVSIFVIQRTNYSNQEK